MKKICLLFIFNLFYVGSVLGESLEFVTTLSQPVGSFAKVNVGKKVSVEALQVNFCNATVGTGTIEMSGAMRAAGIKLEDGTQLSGNVPVYKLQTLNLGEGGVFSAGNMIINQADPSVLSAYKIYANDMSYLIGELGSLKLPDGTMVTANAKIANQDLWWSNEYPRDYTQSGEAYTETGANYTSYLLKTKNPTCDGVRSTDGFCVKEKWTDGYVMGKCNAQGVVGNSPSSYTPCEEPIIGEDLPNCSPSGKLPCQWDVRHNDGCDGFRTQAECCQWSDTKGDPYNGCKLASADEPKYHQGFNCTAKLYDQCGENTETMDVTANCAKHKKGYRCYALSGACGDCGTVSASGRCTWNLGQSAKCQDGGAGMIEKSGIFYVGKCPALYITCSE